MWNARLDEAQAEIKIARRNINNLRYASDTTLMAESQEELMSLLNVKKESEKAGLKHNIQKTKIMAPFPITSWQVDGEAMEMVTDFILGGSKITADGDCSHEIKTLASWKKSCDKPRYHIKKQRHHFANKGLHGQSYGFSSSHVQMWGCTNVRAVQMGELDHKEENLYFWMVVLEKTVEGPLDGKEIQSVNPEGNQPWVFIGRTDAEAEAQSFGRLMWWADSLEKTLMLGKIEGKRRRGLAEDEMVR